MSAKQSTFWVQAHPRDSIPNVADKLVAYAARLMRTAKTEEDLRVGFEKGIDPVMRELGIVRDPRYEKAIYLGGRADAVHGQVILEYEAPRSFRRISAVEHTHDQLVGYICGEARGRKDALFVFDPKLIGVGFDGEQIFFVHYRGDARSAKTELDKKDFVRLGPYHFNRESATTFLAHMRALNRRLLTAEELARVFGPKTQIAAGLLHALKKAFLDWAAGSRVRAFYDEWRRLFGIVYGEQFGATAEEAGESLSSVYGQVQNVDFPQLLFCLHTYFVLLMKLIAAELVTLSETSFMSSFSHNLSNADDESLARRLREVEDGGLFAKRGITNFLEGDFFQWYLDALSPELCDKLRDLARGLAEFEPATPAIAPHAQRDLLKKLYQYLVPQDVRHHLGEYYTPDWLAEMTLDESGYDGDPRKRLLDPACGSGTFLVLAIQRAKQNAAKRGEPPRETAKRILANIWGFDLNPLAVIAARTNYLFALGDLIRHVENPEIPVYLADSVLWPRRVGQMELAVGETVSVPTAVENFRVPAIWVNQNGFLMKQAAPLVESMARQHYSADAALKRLKRRGLVFPPHEAAVKAFYGQVLALETEKKNGIWARFLKNAFAPMVAERFDYVVGNPPWIRWGYLSQAYREATLPLWTEYGLFSLKGMAARLGGGEKDFSMLFAYAALDFYVAPKGTLAFLITQEVFKSKGAGEGFRRFRIGGRAPFRVTKAHDLVAVQPFEGAANKTALLVARKGQPIRYPVPYTVWTRKKRVGRIPTDASLADAKPLLQKKRLLAQPIGQPTGSWQTISPGQENLSAIHGENAYQARLGARVEPYGVFCVEIIEVIDEKPGRAVIRNLFQSGKRSIEKVEDYIETDLLFPAVRGSDIERWECKPEIHVLIAQDPQTSSPYPRDVMMERWPRTYGYLTNFKEILLSRGSKTVRQFAERTEFYAMFGIGPYTVARYKVVWKRMAGGMVAAVASQVKTPYGFKTIVPTDTTSLIATADRSEAHYLCAILNSTPVREFIKTYSSAGRGFGAPSVVRHVGIPRFDAADKLHRELAELSRSLHDLKQKGELIKLCPLENKVDKAAMRLFGVR